MDQGLRSLLPSKPDVVRLLVSDSAGRTIQVTLHNSHGVLHGKGLGTFFRRYQTESPRLYLLKRPGLFQEYSVLTEQEVNSGHVPGVGAEAPVDLDKEPNGLPAVLNWLTSALDRPDVDPDYEELKRVFFDSLRKSRAGRVPRTKRAKSVPPGISVRSAAGSPVGIPAKTASGSRQSGASTTAAAANAASAAPVTSAAPATASGNAAEREKDFAKLASTLITEGLLQGEKPLAIPVDPDSVDSLLAKLNEGRFDSLQALALHEEASLLSISPGFDRLMSLDVVRNLTPYPYQLKAVREVLERMRGRAILADEVGLGKTIEAGLVMMEYVLRGLARRILVLCPPPLILQWQEELKTKFNMDFVLSDDRDFASRQNPWAEVDKIVASIDTAKNEANQKLLQDVAFDLVIVDEAHRCRNKNTLNWKLVNDLKKKYILLLSATPVQNDLQELFNLITLLRPGQLETAADFARKFITRGDRLKPKNTPALRSLMREVMVRNRRDTCGLTLPKRKAETVRVALTAEEARFYDEISAFVRGRYNGDRGETATTTGALGPARLTLKTLQKEAGSSPFAVVPTLLRLGDSKVLRGGETSGELAQLADLGRGIRVSAKASALYKLLQATNDKVVVFTGYTATLNYLAGFLRQAGVSYATFSGEMTRRQKEDAIQAFRGDARVLVSTESGGEGRNLQFCHVMVNYDLPWNPMRIEQRIGRIHRIGQENEVYIFNLSADRTLEAHILDILDAKINLFELVVGELDMILGDVEGEEDFEDTVLNLWARGGSEDELHEAFGLLGDKLAQAKARYDRVREYDDKLFGAELATAD